MFPVGRIVVISINRYSRRSARRRLTAGVIDKMITNPHAGTHSLRAERT